MDEGELINFIYMLVGTGLVLGVYYPGLLSNILPWVAVVGAFYFLWGISSKITSAFYVTPGRRRDDWWNGLAILAIVAFFFGRMDLALNAFNFLINLVFGMGIRVLTLSL